jgi:hypothetical protein
MNKKTESSVKVEKLIEKIINANNEYEYFEPVGRGRNRLVKVKLKFDKKTNIDEIDDEFIEINNKIFGLSNRIPYGTKYYGTIYLKIVEIKYVDENGKFVHLSLNDSLFDRDSDLRDISVDIIDVLEKWLDRDVFYFDIDFSQ